MATLQAQSSEADEAAFTLAKDEGLSPLEYLEAIRLYKKLVGGIESKKRVDLQTACESNDKSERIETGARSILIANL